MVVDVSCSLSVATRVDIRDLPEDATVVRLFRDLDQSGRSFDVQAGLEPSMQKARALVTSGQR